MSEYSQCSNGIAHVAGKVNGITGCEFGHMFAVGIGKGAWPSGDNFTANFHEVTTKVTAKQYAINGSD